jgi:integrase
MNDQIRFTKHYIESLTLPEGKDEAIFWDPGVPGFGVRVRQGSKKFRIQYRVNGQQRSESLGDVRKIDLDAARKIAKTRFAQVELGQDPGANRAAKASMELTLERVIERYLIAKQSALARNSFVQARMHLTKYWRPLHSTPIDEVKREQVAAMVRDFATSRGKTAARGSLQALSALYGWAAREGLSECVNPAANINDPAAGTRPRDRVLKDEEIRIIWQVADTAGGDFPKVLKLCLLTGMRREEAGQLRWDEVDIDTGKMMLPGTRVKNGRAHELVLPEMALDIIRSQPRTGRPFIFGSRASGITAWSFQKLRFDKLVTETIGRALPNWTVHDTRRTAATRIAEFSSPHIVEAILNHAKPALVGTYNLATYQTEKAQALAAWAERLAAIVEGRESKIVPLRA